jgi:peroxiredoxin
MPLFDSEIRAKNQGNILSGQWILHLADKDAVMKFNAKSGDDWRFLKANKNPNANISGRWSTTFTSLDSVNSTIAVGEFREENGRLSGTFLTSTGDYRFLEGTLSDNKLYLSSFDGGNAYLFTANLSNDSTIVDGKFYSGFSGIKNWIARKDVNAILPDAYSLTALKKGYNKIDFTFPALDGNEVSLSDETYKNKVVLVQFLGSWCPNCMDETAYLVPFYNRYNKKGVEIIGLAYERTKDFERSRKNVVRLRDRFNVPYKMLITGFTNKNAEVASSLPMLNNFEAFPTLIIIDKKGVVRKIHTGFNGPGTGKYYTEFVREFEKTIDDLLAEN